MKVARNLVGRIGNRPSLLAALVLAFGLLVSACEQDLAIPVQMEPQQVTPFLASGFPPDLIQGNRLVLPEPAKGAHPQITPQQATQLAVTAARTWGPYIRIRLQEMHGAPINFETLAADGRPLFASAPYEDVPANVHPGARNLYGPYYLVHLLSNGEPVLSVAVAAYTQASIQDGRIVTSLQNGNDFIFQGLAKGKGYFAPVTPERAVELVGSATGARVASVPELVRPDRDQAPQFARWRVSLDRAVAVRGAETGAHSKVRQLYVGLGGAILIPKSTQPAETTVESIGPLPGTRLRIRGGSPVAFERAELLTN
jgi:hypothetical protein